MPVFRIKAHFSIEAELTEFFLFFFFVLSAHLGHSVETHLTSRCDYDTVQYFNDMEM